jgi:hypothetical protein
MFLRSMKTEECESFSYACLEIIAVRAIAKSYVKVGTTSTLLRLLQLLLMLLLDQVTYDRQIRDQSSVKTNI